MDVDIKKELRICLWL